MLNKELGGNIHDSALSSNMGQIGATTVNLGFSISPQKVTRFLFFVILGLTALSLIGHFSLYLLPDLPLKEEFSRKFALNKEQNFPTLYSSLALFCSAILLFVIAHLKATIKNRYTLQWRALGFVFVYLSLDEIVGLHELMSDPLHKIGVNGFFHNAWLLPGTVILLIFSASFARFIFHLPRRTRNQMFLAAALFVGGAFVVELFDGYYAFIHGRDNIGYALFSTLEEVLEMLGVMVFIHSLLDYLTRLDLGRLNLQIRLKQEH